MKQINRVRTKQSWTVSGLNFKGPLRAEMELSFCLRGEVFDLAVDLRLSSPTFLGRYQEVMGEPNLLMLAIPKGLARGFEALGADCDLLCPHTGEYGREAKGGCNPADPLLSISWPLPFADQSIRDKQLSFIPPGSKGVIS